MRQTKTQLRFDSYRPAFYAALRCQIGRFMHFSFHLPANNELNYMKRCRGAGNFLRHSIEIIMRIWGRQHWDTGTLGLPIHRATSLLTRFFKLPLALDRAHAAGPGGIWKRWGSRKTTYNTDAQWSRLTRNLKRKYFQASAFYRFRKTNSRVF